MSIAKMTEFLLLNSFMWYISTKTIYFHINMNNKINKLAYFRNNIKVNGAFPYSESPVKDYFSVQNFTSLPSSIILVVLTAHILPHIEQV